MTIFHSRPSINDGKAIFKDYLFAIAEGDIEDHFGLNKFGYNPIVGATAETIWTQGGIYTYMTSASTLYISSTDGDDDQIYEVQGFDADWNFQVKNVTANGNNFVAIDGTWMRVFRVKNLGTTDNAGIIYIADDNTDGGGDGIPDTASNIKAQILIGDNQTLMAVWSVPAGATFYMTSMFVSSSVANKTADVEIRVRPFGGVFQIKRLFTIGVGVIEKKFDPPLVIDAKSDIEIRAGVSGGGGKISAGFDGWYES